MNLGKLTEEQKEAFWEDASPPHLRALKRGTGWGDVFVWGIMMGVIVEVGYEDTSPWEPLGHS